jgi:transglutaminase-like putative cysteine protease
MSMLGVLAFLNVARAAAADSSLYRFAPVPRWVSRVAAENAAPPPAGGVSDGAWDLLLDRQFNLTADGDDYYQHSAVQVTNAAGVDERSQIDIDVDPTFQTLSLNSIRVVRQGRVIDQRPVARVTAVPQETELRNRIYNGTYNVNILLFDVRVGDVIDYEYTLHSRERFFPGQFSSRATIAWSVPLHWERLRILAPTDRALSYQIDDHSAPATRIRGTLREWSWEWHDVAAIAGDDNRPGWYSPWPHFQVTTSKDWSDVARRVAPLFRLSSRPAAALQALAKDIRAAGGTPAEQALHALQFVQEQIRYVSIAIGPGAFRPAPPEEVLERRFGDCKDKSLLLVALLRELGIEADPALVNSRLGRGLDAFLPTPYAFDHAIVRMRLGKDVYWLDPTREKQFSPVTSNAVGDFERALVLAGSASGLAIIPRPAPETGGKRSEVLIDLRAGIDKPAKLQIATFYTGTWADSERGDLADQSVAERERSYLKYILAYYPRARVAAPISVHDDPAKNILEVREYYEIDRPLANNDEGRPRIFLQADEIYRYLDPEKVRGVRKAPLATAYPAQVQQTVRVLLPWALNLKNETFRIDNPAFRYQDDVIYSKGGAVPQLTVAYRYESLADSVDPPALAKYIDDRTRAYEDTGYRISPGTGPGTVRATFVKAEPRWPLAAAPLWVMLASLLLAVWLAIRFMFRWDPSAAIPQADWPVGIRGWLLVPAIVLFLTLLDSVAALYNWARYLQVDRWQHLHGVAPVWAPPLMLVLTGCGVCLVVAQALLVQLFFTKRSSAPYAFIAIAWLSMLYWAAVRWVPIVAHLRAAPNDAILVGDVTGAVLRAAIYTAYLLRSRRVKATFVVRLAERRGGLTAATAPALQGS